MTRPDVQFYVGLVEPAHVRHFDRAFVSVNRLRRRKTDFPGQRWIMDSGAFTEISTFGAYRHSVDVYATDIRRWSTCGALELAVAQDYMCEPFILAKTGLTVADHQRLTIERYDALARQALPVPIMPVLQGFEPADYVRHLVAYGERLVPGMRVGVGSVCKRNANPEAVLRVLSGIHRARPDLRLHGFGIKTTALCHAGVRSMLYSADSMAWSFAARWEGRDRNDWREAKAYETAIGAITALRGQAWQALLDL